MLCERFKSMLLPRFGAPYCPGPGATAARPWNLPSFGKLPLTLVGRGAASRGCGAAYAPGPGEDSMRRPWKLPAGKRSLALKVPLPLWACWGVSQTLPDDTR
mmetsp:Transcript_26635/g.79500  ORF Transcript_26635/g.79500 Transcript_26635/m.79500 type:complete len:102 (+) Transcript_26635:108-413(+)